MAILLTRAQKRRGVRYRISGFILSVTGPLLLVGGFSDSTVRTILWSVAAAVFVSLPWLLRRELEGTWPDPGHLTERFGLLMIIALGETTVEIGFAASRESPAPARVVAVVAGYALACSLWWAYFVFAIRAVRLAVARARVQEEIVRPVLLYGHMLLIWGIIGVACGLRQVVPAPGEHLDAQSNVLLVGGCTLYLATFGYTQWRTVRSISWYRIGAALACLTALPFSLRLPALAVVLVLLAVTAALNVVEQMAVRRHGLEHLWRFGLTVPGAPEPNVRMRTDADRGAGADQGLEARER